MASGNDPLRFDWRDGGGDDASAIDRLFKMAREPGEGGAKRPELDRFFDNDLPDDEAELLYEHLRRERSLAREVLGTQRAIDALREVPGCPDFSSRILRRVDRSRGLLDRGWMGRLMVGRIAIAAAVLLVAGGVFALQGISSKVATIGQPTPIGDLAGALPGETAWARGRLLSAASGLGAGGGDGTPGFDADAAVAAGEAAYGARRAGSGSGGGFGGVVGAVGGAASGLGSGQASGSGVVVSVDVMAAAMGSRAALASRSVSAAASEPVAGMVVGSPVAMEMAMLGGRVVELPEELSDPVLSGSVEMGSVGRAGGGRVGSLLWPEADVVLPPVASVVRSDADGREGRSAGRGRVVERAVDHEQGRVARPIVTDECVYFMGSSVDRSSFDVIWAGFTALPSASLH